MVSRRNGLPAAGHGNQDVTALTSRLAQSTDYGVRLCDVVVRLRNRPGYGSFTGAVSPACKRDPGSHGDLARQYRRIPPTAPAVTVCYGVSGPAYGRLNAR